MLTAKDISLLRDLFVTKNEFKKFTDKILGGLDAVMGELKTVREELVLISGRLSEDADSLENHETRLGKLEKRVNLSTA